MKVTAWFVGSLIMATAQAFVPATSSIHSKQEQSSPFFHVLSSSSSFSYSSTSSSRSSSLHLSSTDVTGSSSTMIMNPLMQFFLESLIQNGVPTLFTIIVIAFAAKAFSNNNNNNDMDESLLQTDNPLSELYDDLYGDVSQQSSRNKRGFSLGPPAKRRLPKNSGIPAAQYLKVTHLNRQYDSYDYSLQAATQSKAAAAASFRQTSFQRALAKATSNNNILADLPPSTLQALQQAEADLIKEGAVLVQQMQALHTKLTAVAVDDELRSMGLDTAYPLDPAPVDDDNLTTPTTDDNATTTTSSVNATQSTDKVNSNSNNKTKTNKKKTNVNADMKELSKLTMDLQKLELDFIGQLVQSVGPVHGPSVRAALLGDVAARGGSAGLLLTALQERPLAAMMMGTSSSSSPRRVFVTRFPGDTTASQVANLREEVTAIVRSARPGDEALVVLQTGGGTVTGYGLAAAQLLRFKQEAGMTLTIAVEQVAASGGYMMCCVADRIIASPFAVLGSIGVISDIPNVYERLKKEGIEFQTVTAGKYKRTLTPTKKVTKEDFEKTKGDVEEILVLFRDFVAQNRPQLDIDRVATGETWFGTKAMELNLCDAIQTVDSLLMEYVGEGNDVYEVEYSPPVATPFGLLQPAAAQGSSQVQQDDGNASILRRGIRWLVRTVAEEVKGAIADSASSSAVNQPVQERYLAQDDSASRIKAQE